jgi:hypothetical protein
MMLPITAKEAKELGVPRFFTGRPCKRGHVAERYTNSGHCIACDNERVRPVGQRQKITKKYYEAHKQKCHAAVDKWKKKVGLSYEYTKRSRAKNPLLMHFANAKRHAAKMQRTPAWLNPAQWFEIECVYRYCAALRKIGLDYEVDHVVPLQGNDVSGLHVPWNLQVLTASENASKGNRTWL